MDASSGWLLFCHVLFRHVLPDAATAVIVQATVIMPVAIIGEATLSFLGLVIRAPAPSLGVPLSPPSGTFSGRRRRPSSRASQSP